MTSEAPRAEPLPLDAAATARGDRVARIYLRFSLLFLVVGSVLITASWSRVVFPDRFGDVALLSFGRLFPVAVDLFVYGWLTLGLIGAGFHILPRLAGKALAHERLALAGAGLLVAGFVSGSAGVLVGFSEGRQYLEFPLWADVVVLAGLAAVARVFLATIGGRRSVPLAPTEWFFAAAPVSLVLGHVVGNLPGLEGVNSALQTEFYRGALFGLWIAAAGVGVAYYLVSDMTGRDPRRITQLSVVGFWSIAFVFALSAGSRLTYTPAPDWLETIGGVFSIALFLPVAIVLADLAIALRSGTVRRNGAASALLAAGAVGFALAPMVNVALSLRSSNAVVGLTEWVFGLDVLILFGAFSLWLLAFVHQSSLTARTGRGHAAFTVVAIAAAAGTLLVAGLQAGVTWLGAANSAEVSAGESFRATAEALRGHHWVVLAGFGLFALAQVWVLFAAWSGPRAGVETPEPATDGEPSEEPPGGDGDEADDLAGLPEGRPIGFAKAVTGAVALFAVAASFALVFPLFEQAHGTATLLADEVRIYPDGAAVSEGRAVYLAEGCWYCHTQQVRGIATDVRLGPVAQPGDYVYERPSTAGLMRLGPDLMFVGSRDVTADWVEQYLPNPRGVRSWSTMPGHGYLSRGDLEKVAAYLASLKPFVFE
jgi:cytochrome c oxidase cbb3-type subunit 1